MFVKHMVMISGYYWFKRFFQAQIPNNEPQKKKKS